MADMKWGIICSVPDFSSAVEDKLTKFGEWLVYELEDYSNRFYLFHGFAEEPSFCFYSEPCSKEAIYTVYEKIYRQHPDVLYVIHILPQKNSLEYTLMKELTLNYALIGQGILLETAYSKFKDVKLDDVLGKMNQYIMRRMSQLITFQRADYKFRLVIHAGDTPLPPAGNLHGRFHDVQVEKCVEAVLHSTDDNECATSLPGDLFEAADLAWVRDSPEALIVEGFPTVFNKFQMASLFSHAVFRPLSVFVTAGGRAYVEFANKFHVVQAALAYIRDAAVIAANAEAGVRLRMRCADAGAQACLERRLANSVNAKRSELNASILASPA